MSSATTDTNQTAEQVQLLLLRQAGIARRLDLAADMTRFAIDGACTALRRRYPNANNQEILLLFAEQHYGLALAHRVRSLLASQAD